MAVVLTVPEPWATEINGLRRALGDTQLDRIGPHITLVPPVNVPEEELEEAFGVVMAAAAPLVAPIELSLGPVTTFHPSNPVLYLDVGPVELLTGLSDRLLVGPFDRPREREFVPHVTVDINHPSGQIDSAVGILDGWQADVAFDRVDLMQLKTVDERARWVPIGDVVFSPVDTVDAGPLRLELAESTRLDPVTASVLSGEDALGRGDGEGLVVTARTGGRVIGLATGRRRGRRSSVLRNVHVVADQRGFGVGRRLVEAWERAAERGGARRVVAPTIDEEGAGLLAHLGWGTTDPILDRRFDSS